MREDLQLVERSLAGDPEAFAGIVARYQGAVSAVCYSATGDLALSEDLAQEAFIVAWKGLADLEDRSKLASWLCGIARNLARNARRKGAQRAARRSRPLEEAPRPSDEPTPLERAITKEEEHLLWRTVEELPQTYREPLVLFYREGRSVRSVADALDIGERAARQRLSRARSMVKAEMSAVVEGALSRSRPGTVFTAAVVAALPSLVFAPKAAAATAGATAAAGAGSAVSRFLHDASKFFFKFLLYPLITLHLIFNVRKELSEAQSAGERKTILRYWIVILVALPVVPAAGLFALLMSPFARGGKAAWPLVPLLALFVLGAAFCLGLAKQRAIRRIRIKDGTWREPPNRVITGRVIIYFLALCAPLVCLSAAAYAAGRLALGAIVGICVLLILQGDIRGFKRAEDPRRHFVIGIWAMAALSVLFWSRVWPEISAALDGHVVLGGLTVIPLWAWVGFWIVYLFGAHLLLSNWARTGSVEAA